MALSVVIIKPKPINFTIKYFKLLVFSDASSIIDDMRKFNHHIIWFFVKQANKVFPIVCVGGGEVYKEKLEFLTDRYSKLSRRNDFYVPTLKILFLKSFIIWTSRKSPVLWLTRSELCQSAKKQELANKLNEIYKIRNIVSKGMITLQELCNMMFNFCGKKTHVVPTVCVKNVIIRHFIGLA